MAYEQKTKPTGQDVTEFLDQIPDENRRRDCYRLVELMREVSQEEPYLLSGNMVGFGKYHYKYPSGHEGDSCLVGFAPRKDNLTLYTYAWAEGREDLLERLGKHKRGKGCIYIKKLSDVDENVVRELVALSVARIKELYPE